MNAASLLKKLGAAIVCLCLLLAVAVGSAWLFRYHLLAAYLGISQPVYGSMLEERDVRVPMRDGVHLSADVFRPDAPGEFPTLLVRTPYGKEPVGEVTYGPLSFSPAILFTQRGFNLVFQDTRGRFDSEGTFYAFRDEDEDGEDVLKWLAEQPWFNGELGTLGPSYLGYTQWALAPAAGDSLKCMSPMVISADLRRLFYRGGAIALQTGGGWATGVGKRRDGDHGPLDSKQGMWHLPLRDSDDAAGADVAFFNDWVSHPLRDDYWHDLDMRKGFSEVAAPALFITGWYDIAVGPQLEDFTLLREVAASEAARNPRLIVGPWGHGQQEGDVDFGEDAELMAIVPEMFDWNDYWLRGLGTLPEKPVKIFVMGINEWREEEAWPLERARATPYYLHRSEPANSVLGGGSLDTVPPGDKESSDRFRYDPANPVPTNGGCFLGSGMGARDQRETEERHDVLVYTTEPLAAPLEVTGPIRMVLYASTSGDDTDFTAKLCDVRPDGTSINLAEGIIRGRYREEGQDQPLVPGQIYRFEIDLWATSNVFLAGHRIRVQVSSSNFPQFDRNLNVYGPFAEQMEFVTAEQTIYHDAEHASHIVLPVIP